MASEPEAASTPPLLPGYPSLAHFLTSDQDHCTAIHRRFSYLSAYDLIMYETELSELEEELFELHKTCFWRAEHSESIRQFKIFRSEAEIPDSDASKRWHVTLKLRKLLKEYREAVHFDDLMLSRPTPTSQDYDALHNTFWNHDEQERYPLLGGASTTLYNNRHDLMSISSRTQREDRLSRLLQAHFGLFFQAKADHIDPSNETNSLIYTSHARINTFVTMVAVALAAAFLSGSIWSLYYVRRPETILGLVTMWTTLFAALVALITNARRADIFGASAAYAAVLVVFVGNILGNGSR